MEIQVLYVCLVLAVLFFPLPSTGQPRARPNIDFYQLVFQWPGTLCTVDPHKCGSNIPKGFTLHGLWPDDSSNRQGTPTKCLPRVPFHLPIPAQQLLLQRDWPNIFKPSRTDMWLWKHEWEEHGTCAPGRTQDQYFDLGLKLFKEFNLTEWLLNQPPPPPPAVASTSGLWTGMLRPNKLDLFAEIFAKYRVYPRLAFVDHGQGKNRKKLLKEIVICHNGQMNISCPSIRASNNPPKPPGVDYYLP